MTACLRISAKWEEAVPDEPERRSEPFREGPGARSETSRSRDSAIAGIGAASAPSASQTASVPAASIPAHRGTHPLDSEHGDVMAARGLIVT